MIILSNLCHTGKKNFILLIYASSLYFLVELARHSRHPVPYVLNSFVSVLEGECLYVHSAWTHLILPDMTVNSGASSLPIT